MNVPPRRGDTDRTDGGPSAPTPRVGLIALVPDRWRGIWTVRHHVVHRLARHFDVIWLEAPRHWREYWGRERRPEAVSQDIPPEQAGLIIRDFGRWLPDLYRPEWLRRAVAGLRVRLAARQLRRRGCSRIVLYIWRPELASALDFVHADLSCYHIDDEYAFVPTDGRNDPAEVSLIQRVDQVFIHSRRLMQRKGTINRNTECVPNGVDYKAYSTPAPEPADIARIPRPRMGYVGVLKSHLNLQLIAELAQRRPQWSFILVGPAGFLGDKEPILERLRSVPNVHIMGNRPIASLPAYVQSFDVCMMCYEVNDYTHSIYPLKLHEYLASGRPIVGTPIDSLLPFRDVVRLATTTQEWERALCDALPAAASLPAAVNARRARAAEHDWDLLVARIAKRILQALEDKRHAATAASAAPAVPPWRDGPTRQ